ncbi:MAG: hypothetical protein PHQ52_07705, partial [Candidatus Omnitrophica bacterium]|nr:hypothetical protein [Candidatus Omnitrophota bacterium]
MKIDLFGVKGRLGIEFTKEHVKITLLSQSKDRMEILFLDAFHVKDVSEQQISRRIAEIISALPVKIFEVELVIPVSGV